MPAKKTAAKKGTKAGVKSGVKAGAKVGAKAGAKKQPGQNGVSVKKSKTKKAPAKATAKTAASGRGQTAKLPAKKAPRKKLPKPIVVSVRHTDQYDVYVGRRNPSYGLPQSPFANPFKGEGALMKFVDYLGKNKELQERAAKELKGKVLACWCRPIDGFQGELMCHAQILASLANDMYIEDCD